MWLLTLTKSVYAIIIGFIASVIFAIFFIKLAKKLKLGQKTSIYTNHSDKDNTPHLED